MTMNCKPIPTVDDRINDIRSRTAEIVNEDILPNEHRLWAARAARASRWSTGARCSSFGPTSRRR